jgi:hypothetical protein
MGEAKRRQAATARRCELIDTGIRDDIATIVRTPAVVLRFADGRIAQPMGRQCLWRALVGHIVLDLLDIRAEIVSGSVLYRTGPDAERDGLMIGAHHWLMAGDQVIDFSTGDWREAVATAGPRRWSITPPVYHWGPRAMFTPPEQPPAPVPAVGCAWHFGFHREDFNALRASYRVPLLAELLPLCRRFELRDRIATAA